jgi:hypothetical protein
MNQTPAAILVLAASVMAYAAHAASMTSHNQASVILTLAGLAAGLWGVISLVAASVREREMLIDSHARLDVLDRVMVREPLRALKEAARPVRGESRRPLEISPDLHAQLNAVAHLEGRDRSEILEETLRKHLPKYTQTHAA